MHFRFDFNELTSILQYEDDEVDVLLGDDCDVDVVVAMVGFVLTVVTL